ncbi:MAG: AAA family ATPase [Planctomycetes bacterium]|nr:AAA family ATPase [Planctomycetota bacterium]
MSELSTFSFKTANFKCFGEQEQGFDEIKPINVIIGRNNSGKSTLLDLLQYTIQGSSGQTKDLQIPERFYRNGSKSKFVDKNCYGRNTTEKCF